MTPRSWHLLLIGGPSGTSKTRAGLDLAHRYGVGAGGRLRAVFLYEPDEAQPLANLSRREPGPDHVKRARVSWLYGDWLARQARRAGLPALPARPWHTQLDRILTATGPPPARSR